MKQTKRLTRNQRSDLLRVYKYTGDLYNTRFVKEDTRAFEIIDDRGRHVIYDKATGEVSYGKS